jgi:hypothetical protein
MSDMESLYAVTAAVSAAVTTAVSAAVTAVVAKATRARLLATGCLLFLKTRWCTGDPRKPCVTRVLVIDDTTHTYTRLKWDAALFRERGWEEIATSVGMGENGRVEIRLVHMYTKRRIVLYPGDVLDTTFPKPPRTAYIQGTVIPRIDSDAEPVDILKRVRKYHGNTLRCASHMFPADDSEELLHKYERVHTMDMFCNRKHLLFGDQMTETKNGSERRECDPI